MVGSIRIRSHWYRLNQQKVKPGSALRFSKNGGQKRINNDGLVWKWVTGRCSPELVWTWWVCRRCFEISIPKMISRADFLMIVWHTHFSMGTSIIKLTWSEKKDDQSVITRVYNDWPHTNCDAFPSNDFLGKPNFSWLNFTTVIH